MKIDNNNTFYNNGHGNDFIADVSGSALLSKARQMRLEQQQKIDSYTEHYNQYEIGTLNGIDRIVKLIERHYR